jgi:plastocyanin
MRKSLLAVAVVGAGAASMIVNVPASQAFVQAVVSGPAAQTVGFATTIVVGVKAAPLVYVNADPLAQHNVVSVDRLGDGVTPVFKSKTIGVGGTDEIGLGNTTPGSSYQFTCSIHPSMTGTLTVEA